MSQAQRAVGQQASPHLTSWQRRKVLAPAGHCSGFERIAAKLQKAGLSHILPTFLPDTIPQSLRRESKRKASHVQHGVSCPGSQAMVSPRPKVSVQDSARVQRGRPSSMTLQVCP